VEKSVLLLSSPPHQLLLPVMLPVEAASGRTADSSMLFWDSSASTSASCI